MLRFGEFRTKAGRLSPYFFNAGLFDDGAKLVRLAEFYARRLLASGLAFDMLFGPAYKGITLAAAAAIELARLRPQRALRLQPQGSQGPRRGRHRWSARRCAGRVVIVDDVITDGASKRESVRADPRRRRRAGGRADRARPHGARRQRRQPVATFGR